MAITIDGDSGVSGVNGSATTPALQGTDSNTGIVFGTDTVQVATGGSTRATVDSDGDLGIGTTSPSGLLHIAKSSGNAKLVIQRSNTASNTDDYGSILWQSSAGNNNALIGAARHSAENDAYMFFSTASGGTLSEELRIQSAGGISFNGDTAQANALDDYEEGTFTPTISHGITGTAAEGYYVKIGVHVTLFLSITWPSTSDGNQARIESFPFANHGTGRIGAGLVRYSNAPTASNFAWHVDPGESRCSCFTLNGGSAITHATTSTYRWDLVVTYRTA